MAARKRHRKPRGSDPGVKARRAFLDDDVGYDWGWRAYDLVSANDQLPRRLAAGQFIGFGYGLISPEGPPFISLVGHNLAGMQSALALMKEWVEKAGSNAIRLEILFDDPGYVLSIAPQPDLLRWRVSGLDSLDKSIVLTIGLIKRLDTRHPFLDTLADYAREPVAPIWLTVGEISPRWRGRSGAAAPGDFGPSWESAILLPGIEIYARAEDRSIGSMVRLESELADEQEKPWPPVPRADPVSVARTREHRLLATLPKTMHCLRHSAAAAPLFAQGIEDSARWQVEQAVCNLRVPSCLAYVPNGKTKRLRMIDALRRELVEPASIVFDPAWIDQRMLPQQIALDAAYLLRRLEPDAQVPSSLMACNERLRELGYG